jgi:hypothetical protein
MDIHQHVEGLTRDAVTGAHARDLEVQQRYGVNYQQYWFDEGSGKVFCLVEAPSREAAIAVHREAHGLSRTKLSGRKWRNRGHSERRPARLRRVAAGKASEEHISFCPYAFSLKGEPIMNPKRTFSLGLLVAVLLGTVSIALAAGPVPNSDSTLVETVRHATEGFKDVSAAEAAGYGLFHGCVSGQQQGAMGIHFVKGELVGDGAVDAQQPEALIYEQHGGQLRLVGVEYVVLADDWNAQNATPPVLLGQLFHLNGSPNRYGIPAFYELHVWAWKDNPDGMFVDWNPRVSCEEYTGDTTAHAATH